MTSFSLNYRGALKGKHLVNSRGSAILLFDLTWRRGGVGPYLKLDYPLLGKAQVHAFRILQVEGALVELGDGVVGVQQRRLLVHFADYLQGGRNIKRLRVGFDYGQGDARKGGTARFICRDLSAPGLSAMRKR